MVAALFFLKKTRFPLAILDTFRIFVMSSKRGQAQSEDNVTKSKHYIMKRVVNYPFSGIRVYSIYAVHFSADPATDDLYELFDTLAAAKAYAVENLTDGGRAVIAAREVCAERFGTRFGGETVHSVLSLTAGRLKTSRKLAGCEIEKAF